MKEEKKYKILGSLVYFILKTTLKTCKFKRILVDKVIPAKELKQNAVYVFWHNKLAAVTGISEGIKKKAALASPSKDGELISVPLEKFGYKVIRGSSGRGSVKSLIAMVRLLKEGYSLGTPVDGPKGPIYEVKPGMLFLSQKSQKPLVPVGVAYSKSWCFKNTWDKLELPKPFSKVVCYMGEPYTIAKEANLEEEALKLKKLLTELDEKAKSYLK